MRRAQTQTIWQAAVLAAAFTLVASTAAFAAVSTDQGDYTPGAVVTISGNNSNGAGYVPGNTVTVAATADNGLWADSCSATVAADETWSCTVTLSSDPAVAVGSYGYTATSTAADGSPISETGTFTDAKTWSPTISGDNSAFEGIAKTYTASHQSGSCDSGASFTYAWTTTAGTATFSDTAVYNPSVTFTSLGTVTLQVTETISGGTCSDSSATQSTTKDVTVTSSTLTETLDPATITYGESTSISGSLVDSDGNGIPGHPIVVSSFTGAGCTGTETSIASSLNTLGGGTTPPKGNWALSSDYTPTAAGTFYIKAYYDGAGNNAPATDCETLTVNPADATVTSAPDLSQSGGVYQAGQNVLFNLNFEVYSDHGVSPNVATGNVAATQSGSGLGCDTTNHGISATQNNADGTVGTKAGFDYIADSANNSGNRIGCTPTGTGTFTVYVTFTDTDGNYNGDDDSPGGSVYVAPAQVQVCKAAPAIAADYLQNVLHVKNNTKGYVNTVSLIAGQMADAQQARFPNYSSDGHTLVNGDLLRPCDSGYAQSVQYRTTYLNSNKVSK